MNNNQVAPNEILQLHELLNANILGAKKLSASSALVKDECLKNLMENSLNGKKGRIQELQDFINNQLGNQLNSQGNNQNSSQNGGQNNNQDKNQSGQ